MSARDEAFERAWAVAHTLPAPVQAVLTRRHVRLLLDAARMDAEAVPALDVFRIAGGDVECSPWPSAEQALACLRDLRECYDEALAAAPPVAAQSDAVRELVECLRIGRDSVAAELAQERAAMRGYEPISRATEYESDLARIDAVIRAINQEPQP